MSIELVPEVTSYLPYVDELFAAERKKSLLTNQDFSWAGGHTVKIYKISTSEMTDYGSSGAATGNWSRYGVVEALDTTTTIETLTCDRSFTFAIDKLDGEEADSSLAAASALARQVREVIIPEVDAHVYGKMCDGAGTTPDAIALTATNIYSEIIKGSNALDNAEVPDANRFLIVTPEIYLLMKQSPDIVMESDIGNDMRMRGVISTLDGLSVIRVPSSRLPNDFGFMLAHPAATVAPTRLEDYHTHQDPPGISGTLVEGRVVYDAFVIENKAGAIYYQSVE